MILSGADTGTTLLVEMQGLHEDVCEMMGIGRKIF